MLRTFDLDEHVYEARRAGASGFLLKSAPHRHLVHAVRSVAEGDALPDLALTRRLVQDCVRRPPPAAGRPDALRGLTDREVEVLALLARGMSNAEIAAHLCSASRPSRPTSAASSPSWACATARRPLSSPTSAVCYEPAADAPGRVRSLLAATSASPDEHRLCADSATLAEIAVRMERMSR